MYDSILVVCTGNICRSPIGEYILRRELPNKKIDSAGTGALVGKNADPKAIKIAAEHGIYLKEHKVQQFTPSIGHQYDLILVMEKAHLEQIAHIAPELRGKTMLFGHWIGQKDIPDPYLKSEEAFSSVYTIIEKSAKCWIEKLSA